MIGFVADPKRVDYWTNYVSYGPLEEFKKTSFWEELSEEDKAFLEWGVAHGKELKEKLRKERKERYALEQSQAKEKEPT